MKSFLAQQILLISLVFVGKLRSMLIPYAIECKYNENICSQSYCMLSKGRGKFKYFNAGCNLIHPLTSASLHIEFLRKMKKGDYRSTNFKLETNLCNLTDAKSGNGIVQNLMSLSLNSLKNFKCPLKGNVTIARMPLLTFVIQGFITDGDYKIYVRTFNDVLTVLDMNISISVTS